MTSCQVCCETTKKVVTCACEFVTCVTCAKRYTLDTHDPHCMSCKRAWGRADLLKNLGSVFTSKTYKTHRENVLFERERAMLPATQARLENYRLEKRLELSISQTKNKLSRLRKEIAALETNVLQDQQTRERLIRTKWETAGTADAVQEVARVDRVTCGCPDQGCSGFLMASNHTCGACGKKACARCNLLLVDGHVCLDADVATAQIIRKETKPCPRCNVPIFRSSGCPQMFCTQCQCVFDWGSGLEQTHGVMHNPHYFDWLAKQGRRPVRADACGFGRLYEILATGKGQIDDSDYVHLVQHVRKAGHFRDQAIPRLSAQDAPADHVELRLQLLDRRIAESTFKTAIQRQEKRRSKEIELRQILETYVAAVRDIIMEFGTWKGDFAPPKVDRAKVPEGVRALHALRQYIRVQLDDLAKVYSVKTVSFYP